MQFSRLTLEEIPQIGNFLRSVWTAKYGEMGFQNFDENYLKWILGGPHKDRNFLLGGKIQNKLVTYCSFLFKLQKLMSYSFLALRAGGCRRDE